MAKTETAPVPEEPTERHRDVELDPTETVDNFGDSLNLEPDFDAEETDEADEVFEDDVQEGVNPDEAVDPNPDEETN